MKVRPTRRHTCTLPKDKQVRGVPLATREGLKEEDWGEGEEKEQPKELILSSFFWKYSNGERETQEWKNTELKDLKKATGHRS